MELRRREFAALMLGGAAALSLAGQAVAESDPLPSWNAGPAKDANLRMIFIDRVDITGPDGKPLGRGSNQLVYLAIPIKQPSTGTVGQMIIGGITADPAVTVHAYLGACGHRAVRASSPLVARHGMVPD